MKFASAIVCLLLPAFASAGSVSAAALGQPPYVGRWDCEVGVFTFTADTYDPGTGERLKAEKVIREGEDYHFTFEDGYGFWVSGITQSKMGWLSDASGDAFNCKRIGR